jgi:hypothetical protein
MILIYPCSLTAHGASAVIAASCVGARFAFCGASELRCTLQSHAVAHARAVNRNGRETAMNIQKMAERVKENIGQVIVGKDEVIDLALVALLGGLQQ